LRPAVALGRAVAEADEPFGRVPQVIDALLLGLRRDGGERFVAGRRHGAPVRVHEGREQHLAHDGCGEVAVRLLDEEAVAVAVHVAQVGEIVLGQPAPVEAGGVVYSERAWPMRSRAMLASASSSSSTGACRTIRQAVPEHQRIVGPRSA
jgi:hypothetical protein